MAWLVHPRAQPRSGWKRGKHHLFPLFFLGVARRQTYLIISPSFFCAPLARSFQSTMKALENLSGYEESDVKAALIVEDDADQSGAEQLTLTGHRNS